MSDYKTAFPADAPSDLARFHRRCIEWAFNQNGVSRRWHISRFAMYTALERCLSGFFPYGAKVLSVSGSNGLCQISGLPVDDLVEADFPEHSLLQLRFPNASFDAVVSDQVLEHLDGPPDQAFGETARVLRAGGVFIHTTCFFNLYHPSPGDFWRFSEAALAALATRAGLGVLTTGSWGSFLAYQVMNDGFRFLPVPEDPGNPVRELAIHSDGRFPITTWVVGSKPLPDQE